MTVQTLNLSRRSKRRAIALPLFPAEVQLFPLTRYAGSVDRLARHLRSLPTQRQRNEAMIAHVEKEWGRLTDLGASEAICEREVVAFAQAVWAKVPAIYEFSGGAA